MKKKFVLLAILVLFICIGCSNKNESSSDKITKENLKSEDELTLLKHKVDVSYEKFIIKGSLLKRIGARKYTIHIDQYENNKKVTNIKIGRSINKDEYDSEFINYYDVISDNCYDDTCFADFLVKNETGSTRPLDTSGMKTINFYKKYLDYSSGGEQELNDKKDININSKVFISLEAYQRDNDNGMVYYDTDNLESIVKHSKAVTVVYVTFASKKH